MCRTCRTSLSLGAVAAPCHSLSHSNNELRRQPRSLLKYSKLPLRLFSLHLKHQQFLCQSLRHCHSRQARLLLVVPLCMSLILFLSFVHQSDSCCIYSSRCATNGMGVHNALQVFHFSLALAPDCGSISMAVLATSSC